MASVGRLHVESLMELASGGLDGLRGFGLGVRGAGQMRLAGTECGTVSVRWVEEGWKVVDVCRRRWYHVIGQVRHLGERSLSEASAYSCAAIHFCCDYILHHTRPRHAGFPHRRQGRRRRRSSSDRRQATGNMIPLQLRRCSPNKPAVNR